MKHTPPPFRKFLAVYSLLLIGMLTIFVFSCKKEKPVVPETKDPCDCAREVTAEFDILEQHHIDINFTTKTDHILSNKTAVFSALEEDAEYTWYLGIETEHTQEASRLFTNDFIGSSIPIILVVKKEPNKLCFPNDDGYDSIVKYMNVYDRCHPHMLDGDFMVAEENSTDSIVVGLHNNEYPPEYYCNTFDIVNYDGKGSECSGYYSEMKMNYRGLKSGGSGSYNEGCKSVFVDKAEINLNNEFILELSYREELGGPKIYKKYYGRKLP